MQARSQRLGASSRGRSRGAARALLAHRRWIELLLCTALVLVAAGSGFAAADESTSLEAARAGSSPDSALAAPRTGANSGGTKVGVPRRRQLRALRVDAEFSALRLGLAVMGLGLYAWGIWLRGRGQAAHLAKVRTVLLVVIAGASYSSYYYFFQLTKPGNLDAEDVYQYYVGSKYSPEIGYFGIHECALAALVETGAASIDEIRWVRDLRTQRLIPSRQAWARGRRCKAAFEPDRWQQFREDVTWFRGRMTDRQFRHVMVDHGYQPGPVWTAMARPLSTFASIDADGPVFLSRGDRFVVLAAFAVVAWAFGIEAACLAAIIWGTGFLWRYSWIGDCYLRQTWFALSLCGISLARKGLHAGAGALLTFSTLLRVFPAVFGVGYLLQALWRGWQERRIPVPTRRFLVGASVAFAVLFAASVWVPERGTAVYGEFFQKISHFADEPDLNKVGLPVLVSHALAAAPSRGAGAVAVTVTVRAAQLAMVAMLLVGLWKAVRRAEPWEGAALGFVLVPMLAQPTNYYYTFVVAAALLATRRPRIGIYVLVASIAWIAIGLLFYGGNDPTSAEFLASSLIAVIFCGLVVLEMNRPPALLAGPPQLAPEAPPA